MNIRPIKYLGGCWVIWVMMVANAVADPVTVFVSIAPQRHFVQQIGKDLVSVHVMVDAGASPATYEPKPSQMTTLAKANVYFAIGVPFESAWLERISQANPGMRVVATDYGIEKRTMASHHRHNEHGKESKSASTHTSENEATSLDPHIWLSPQLVMQQIRIIADALQQIDPDHRSEYEANYETFIARLSQLDRDLRAMFTGMQKRKFFVFHPSWGYFAQDYGLIQVPVEIEGKNPKPAQLRELIEIAKHDGIEVIFVQPQFSRKSSQLIARAIGGKIEIADPLAEDWEVNLRHQAMTFKSALR